MDAGGPGALDCPVMFEKLKETLTDLLDALGADRPVSRDEVDRVLGGMREELIEARARLKKREDEVVDYERRLDALRERDDVAASELSELEREVGRRRAELEEERRAVEEMSERFREAVRRRDALVAKDRRSRASETVREAGEEEVRDFERFEERIEEDAHRLDAEREVEEALGEGAGGGGAGGAGTTSRGAGAGGEDRGDLEETFRDARAEEQLRDLKRRMGMEPDEGD